VIIMEWKREGGEEKERSQTKLSFTLKRAFGLGGDGDGGGGG